MRIILLASFIFSFSSILAQGSKYHTENKKAEKYYEAARVLLKRAQFYEAMEPLQDALDKDPDFIEVWLAFGSANYRLNRDSLTLYYLNGALAIDPDYKKSIYAYFIIGETYFKQAKYQEATLYLEHYLSRDGAEERNRQQSRNMIVNANYAIKAMENPFEYNIRMMPAHANYFQLQYFPVLSVDQKKLYFTRREGLNVSNDEDIYYSERQISGEWSIPVSISDNINSEFNEGAASLSADGRTLVFTS